jgi:hypothetical protein
MPFQIFSHTTYMIVGGGFLSGRYLSADDQADSGSRFDPEKLLGQVGKRVFNIVISLSTMIARPIGILDRRQFQGN